MCEPREKKSWINQVLYVLNLTVNKHIKCYMQNQIKLYNEVSTTTLSTLWKIHFSQIKRKFWFPKDLSTHIMDTLHILSLQNVYKYFAPCVLTSLTKWKLMQHVQKTDKKSRPKADIVLTHVLCMYKLHTIVWTLKTYSWIRIGNRFYVTRVWFLPMTPMTDRQRVTEFYIHLS